MSSEYKARVLEAVRTHPQIQRQLRELGSLDKKISAIAEMENKKLDRMSLDELMMRIDNPPSPASDPRIAEILAEQGDLCKQMASQIASSTSETSALATWIFQNRKVLVEQMPRRKWWQAFLG